LADHLDRARGTDACLCALDQGDEFGTKGLSRMDAKIIARWTRAGRRGPEPLAVREPRIVSPLELLRRVGDPYFLRPPFQLPLDHTISEAFDDLIDLRNAFLHFSEDGWTIDLRRIPPLIVNACKVIRHLAVTQPIYLRTLALVIASTLPPHSIASKRRWIIILPRIIQLATSTKQRHSVATNSTSTHARSCCPHRQRPAAIHQPLRPRQRADRRQSLSSHR